MSAILRRRFIPQEPSDIKSKPAFADRACRAARPQPAEPSRHRSRLGVQCRPPGAGAAPRNLLYTLRTLTRSAWR